MKQDSTAPVAAKAEQDPHWPWSLTDVTIPSSLQSMVQFMYNELTTARGALLEEKEGQNPPPP